MEVTELVQDAFPSGKLNHFFLIVPTTPESEESVCHATSDMDETEPVLVGKEQLSDSVAKTLDSANVIVYDTPQPCDSALHGPVVNTCYDETLGLL